MFFFSVICICSIQTELFFKKNFFWDRSCQAGVKLIASNDPPVSGSSVIWDYSYVPPMPCFKYFHLPGVVAHACNASTLAGWLKKMTINSSLLGNLAKSGLKIKGCRCSSAQRPRVRSSVQEERKGQCWSMVGWMHRWRCANTEGWLYSKLFNKLNL